MSVKNILSSTKTKHVFTLLRIICFYLIILEGLGQYYSNEIQSNENWGNAFRGLYALYNMFILIVPSKANRIILILFGLTLSWVILKMNKSFETIYSVIVHVSYKEGQYTVDSMSTWNKLIEPHQIELSDHFDGLSDYSSLTKAIETQDKQLDSIRLTLGKKTLGYLGIAHTPLIARAGYLIGDGINVALFHKKRNTRDYELLHSKNSFPGLRIKENKLVHNSKELIVIVATTFEVINEELSVFNIEDKNLLYFDTVNKGYDVILSITQIETYVSSIMQKIREISKENQISKIHMILSTSVALTFKLGQAISSNNDPEVIFYHYDRNSQKKYVWGVQIKNSSQDCVVMM